jgi:glutaminyl-tRNA synthetase
VSGEFGGQCNLRFDDTNPEKEDQEFVDSIQEDIRWLGFDWEDRLYFASDYFERLYTCAQELIRGNKAYVCSLTAEEIRSSRGTLTEAGADSPYRGRSVQENLDLFERMRAGEFADGAHVLRAKIDMASPNMNMRDPTLYRVRHVHHHRTGDAWCIYPMYDYAHCLSDAFEGITHSLCTLEFEDHRPLYDWILDELKETVACHPQQIEFARLKLTHTLMSKRKLKRLVDEGFVAGWDDPRMPTLSGLRRRGIPPAAIRDFCDRIGLAKADSVVDDEMLWFCVREELNRTAERRMVILDPLRLTIENYPEGQEEILVAVNNPNDPNSASREIPFSRTLLIERDDFLEQADKGYFRFTPGREVRLQHAYYLTCTGVRKDPASGAVIEVLATYDPLSRGGQSEDGRKVKGTVHWVSASHATDIEVRLFNDLFPQEEPESAGELSDIVDRESAQVITARAEPALTQARPEERFQFLRLGYFVADRRDHCTSRPVFNRIVPLRDTRKKGA